jgi:heme peroxidase
MPSNLIERISRFLETRRPWYRLPRVLAMPRLIEIRNELREKNLHDTEEPPFDRQQIPPDLDPKVRAERTIDGTYNDLNYPQMGSCGRRFGRNVPLDHVFPDTANLLIPNPRIVSRELMTRDRFKPVPVLNLLAASWIQFQVHDWFVHKRSPADDVIAIPTPPGDDWGEPAINARRTVPEPALNGSTRPPAYANPNSHWWDGSQIYGSDTAVAKKMRMQEGGKLRIEATGQLPIDAASGIHFSGFTDNWWVGLAMLHTLFTLEHNHICDRLAAVSPGWDDDRLYGHAKLINSALLAKIHTLEWTPAILPHPVIQLGMRANWSGLAGDELQDVFEFLQDSEILGGIIGSKTDHHTAPYSLTEEFVAVYRMHPLMPDQLTLRSLAGGGVLETRELPEIAGRHTPGVCDRISMPDLFYSFGVSHPGAITLHNYPKHLQNLRSDSGERLDVAAIDILRDRERGVPRYNQFRRLIHKPAVKSFDELTDNTEWRNQIRAVYGNDLEAVDLMTGLFAEPLPDGFGFSETAFRIFILMASRRLKSDRFFTNDWTAQTYTEFGLEYIKQNTMRSVLKRHYPAVAPALAGVENPFHPWKPVP